MTLHNPTRKYKLHAIIKSKRNEMIELGMTYGFTDKRTVACSQLLDQLLNDYVKLSRNLPNVSSSVTVVKN